MLAIERSLGASLPDPVEERYEQFIPQVAIRVFITLENKKCGTKAGCVSA
jgi:hypothetical protein